jgi:preprotein translocase subunit SecD
MDRSWNWRLAIVLVVTVLSVYQLIPTWHYFKLSPEARNTDVFDKSVPSWAPKARKHLTLGLDLQGGIHLALGVDVDKAVKAKVTRRADEIASWLKEKKVAFDGCAPSADGVRVECRTTDAAALEKSVSDGYGNEMYVPAGAPAGTVQFGFMDKVVQEFRAKAVEQAEKTIRNRIDKWGVTEPDIKRKGTNQVQIQLPGFKDPQKAKELIGRTAQLEFRICDDESPALDPIRSQLPVCPSGRDGMHFPLPEGGCWTVENVELPTGASRENTVVAAADRAQLDKVIAEKVKPLIDPSKQAIGVGESFVGEGAFRKGYHRTFLMRSRVEMTGDYIADARASFDQGAIGGGKPIVTFAMSAEGARLMEKLTTENVKRRMATVLDDKVETAPYIQSTISSNGQITLGGGKSFQEMNEEANEIALVLKAGALPAPVTIFEERTVGATLGPELVKKGTLAALVGLGIVLVFMALYYRGSGLIADVALALNGVLVLAVMSMFGSTLTLPGIAGFVLTLGMAVDANVLINERIREELRAGKGTKQAVQLGYDKVFWTIVDAHVTTLAAAVVLMNYGTGPVRGFAVTLIIGLLASMFTSIVVTRVMMEYFTRHETARLSV